MSLAYQKMKMRATSLVVGRAREFCDGCGIVLNAMGRPLRRLGDRISAEAPWVIVLIASTLISVIPLVAYPALKPLLVTDPREEMERERVRLCLQKGIDPYPYMRHKDFVYGNRIGMTMSEDEAPREASWEHRSVLEFQQRKEELRNEVGGSLDDTVEKLMRLKAAQHKEMNALRNKISGEPVNLQFWGRKDVDELKS